MVNLIPAVSSTQEINKRFDDTDRILYLQEFIQVPDTLTETDLRAIYADSKDSYNALFEEAIPWQVTYATNPYINLNNDMVNKVLSDYIGNNMSIATKIEQMAKQKNVSSYFPKIRLLRLIDELYPSRANNALIDSTKSDVDALIRAAYSGVPLYRIEKVPNVEQINFIVDYVTQNKKIIRTPAPQVTYETGRVFETIEDAIAASLNGEVGVIPLSLADMLKITDENLLAEYPIILEPEDYIEVTKSVFPAADLLKVMGFPDVLADATEKIFTITHGFPPPALMRRINRYMTLITLPEPLLGMVRKLYNNLEITAIASQNNPNDLEPYVLDIGIDDERVASSLGLVPPPYMSVQQYVVNSVLQLDNLIKRNKFDVPITLNENLDNKPELKNQLNIMTDQEILNLYNGGYVLPYISHDALVSYTGDLLNGGQKLAGLANGIGYIDQNALMNKPTQYNAIPFDQLVATVQSNLTYKDATDLLLLLSYYGRDDIKKQLLELKNLKQ